VTAVTCRIKNNGPTINDSEVSGEQRRKEAIDLIGCMQQNRSIACISAIRLTDISKHASLQKSVTKARAATLKQKPSVKPHSFTVTFKQHQSEVSESQTRV